MKTTPRIEEICGHIDGCNTLADVGCDHGYIAEIALKNNLCKRCVITDISKKSLLKAEKLLSGYIDGGRVIPYCTDGLSGVSEEIDFAVIAGMGGIEIIGILKAAGLDKILLQPMKNSFELRVFLTDNGYRLLHDYTFFCGDKHYDLIKAEKGADSYQRLELIFGRDNLKSKTPQFIKKLEKELKNAKKYLKNCKNSQNIADLQEKIRTYEEVLYG